MVAQVLHATSRLHLHRQAFLRTVKAKYTARSPSFGRKSMMQRIYL